jgi:phage FluMu protein Com
MSGGLPIIPHELFGADCCGCLYIIMGEEPEYRCNECNAVIPREDVQRIVLQMASCEATCPHCGRVNEISGFSEVSAFVCRFCGTGVDVDLSYNDDPS